MRTLILKELSHHKGFSYLGHTTQDKNNLYKEIRKLLLQKSHKILSEEGDIIRLVDEVIDGVNQLNEKFSKCKPVIVHFEYLFEYDGLILRGCHCDFMIYFEGDFDRVDISW